MQLICKFITSIWQNLAVVLLTLANGIRTLFEATPGCLQLQYFRHWLKYIEKKKKKKILVQTTYKQILRILPWVELRHQEAIHHMMRL